MKGRTGAFYAKESHKPKRPVLQIFSISRSLLFVGYFAAFNIKEFTLRAVFAKTAWQAKKAFEGLLTLEAQSPSLVETYF